MMWLSWGFRYSEFNKMLLASLLISGEQIEPDKQISSKVKRYFIITRTYSIEHIVYLNFSSRSSYYVRQRTKAICDERYHFWL